MTNEHSLQLLVRILSISEALEQKLNSQPDEMESFLELLDDRQQVMDDLSQLIDEGHTISEERKHQYLIPAFEITKRITPKIEAMKKDTQIKLQTIQKQKIANQQYHHGYEDDYTPYGAFFDKRK